MTSFEVHKVHTRPRLQIYTLQFYLWGQLVLVLSPLQCCVSMLQWPLKLPLGKSVASKIRLLVALCLRLAMVKPWPQPVPFHLLCRCRPMQHVRMGCKAPPCVRSLVYFEGLVPESLQVYAQLIDVIAAYADSTSVVATELHDMVTVVLSHTLALALDVGCDLDVCVVLMIVFIGVPWLCVSHRVCLCMLVGLNGIALCVS
jgi:hypothetical protein